jgi:hypothetical protein
MNVILTMKIKNGGSTVQMNSAEIYTKDAKVVVLCGSTYSRYESFTSELYFIPKKKKDGLLGEECSTPSCVFQLTRRNISEREY